MTESVSNCLCNNFGDSGACSSACSNVFPSPKSCFGEVQIVDKVVDVPVMKQRSVPVMQKVQKTIPVPQVPHQHQANDNTSPEWSSALRILTVAAPALLRHTMHAFEDTVGLILSWAQEAGLDSDTKKKGVLAKGVSAELVSCPRKQSIPKCIGPRSRFGTQSATAKRGLNSCENTL